MAGKTVGLVLNGEVPLDTFAEAIGHFQRLVRALSREIGGKAAIAWTLADLEFGSADMAFTGESAAPGVVESVARGYVTVGQALARGGAIPYRAEVVKPARALLHLVGDRVTSIEFRADDDTATILAPNSAPQPMLSGAYGAISGRVETLRMRGGLRFTLYDDLFDRPIKCYLRVGQEGLMRDAWGHSVIVEGWVERNSLTGAPVKITDIITIQIVAEPPESDVGFWHARGAHPRQPDEPLPEELIRVLRDA